MRLLTLNSMFIKDVFLAEYVSGVVWEYECKSFFLLYFLK